jgi:hypothetical protein
VKLLKPARGYYKFQIAFKEREVLFQLLRKYPLIPAACQRLSHGGDRPEDRQLLEEALAAQRRQNQRLIVRLIKARTRFRPAEPGYFLSLRAAEIEWLLQVLNDVRVGSWISLGSPDRPDKLLAALNEQTAPHFWAMETAGFFQMMMLKAVGQGK